jgi:IS5 family transposase
MWEGEVSARGPVAGFTRKGQRSFFGYKAYLAVDQGTELIRKAILTNADIGEHRCGCDHLRRRKAVLADKTYKSMSRRDALGGRHH